MGPVSAPLVLDFGHPSTQTLLPNEGRRASEALLLRGGFVGQPPRLYDDPSLVGNEHGDHSAASLG